MKKRVRIYKPKNKFQQGGVQQQYSPDQLITVYMSALSQPGSSIDTAENTLRQLQIDEDTIAQVSEAAQTYITEQQEAHNAQAAGDQSAMADLQAGSDSDEAAAFAEAEEQARSQRMQEMYADYGNQDLGDDTQVASDIIARRGGNMPSKRKFVQAALKLVKKQEGGTDQDFTNPSDSTDTGERKEGLQKFVSALQKTADESLMKKDAEAMYDQFTMMSNEPNPMDYESMDYAQFGGMRPGKQRRMMRKMNRFVGNMPVQMNNRAGDMNLPGVVTFPGMMGMMQQQMPAEGSTYDGPQMANIDVRRTGLFGRPKEYTITFAQQALTDPKLKEEVIKLEEKNQEQRAKDKETEAKVAEQEANKDTEAEDNVRLEDISVVTSKGSNKVAKGKSNVDAWGRPSNSKWYGFNPETKTWTKGKPAWANAAGSSNMVPGTSYTNTNVGPSGQTAPVNQTGNTAGLAQTIGRNKIKNTAQDLYRSLPDAPSKKQMMNWYESLPDVPGLQMGGFSDTSNPDLYKFIYGGDDGKLTNSPYFAYGGLYKFAGEEDSEVDTETNAKTDTETKKEEEPKYIETRVKQKGLPTDVATGQRYMGDMMNPELAAINVYKTRALGPYAGMPKKYSIDYMVDDWDPNGTAAAAANARGRRGEAGSERMGKRLTDRMIDSNINPISWLGSRLQPFGKQADKVSNADNPDNWGINELVEDTKRRQNAQMVAETKLPTRPIQNLSSAEALKAQAEQDILSKERSTARNPNTIDTLPMRPASPFQQTVNTPADIIPSTPSTFNPYMTQEVPYLEPGVSGPMGEDQVKDIEYERQQQQAALQDAMGYGVNGVLNVPNAGEQYAIDFADQNAIAAQKEDIQRMIEQNPDFFTQGIYNNPVFNPEDMNTANTMNLTPQEKQQIAVAQVQQRVPVRTRNRNRNQVPVTQVETPRSSNNRQQPVPVAKADTTKATQPVVAKQPQKSVPKKEETERAYIKPEGSVNYGGNEKTQAAKNEVRRQQELENSKRKNFQKTYGVDKATLDMYRYLMTIPGTEAQRKQMRDAHPGLNKYYKSADGGYMAYGGTPMAANGFETPVDLDPRFDPNLDFNYKDYPMDDDMVYDPIPEDIATKEEDIPLNFSQKNEALKNAANIKTETGVDLIDGPKIDYGRKRVRVNYKDKGPQKTNAEIQKELMAFNYLGNQALNLFGERGDAERKRQQANMTGSEFNYGSTGIQDRGTYNINSGLIPDMGFTGVAKYGGYYQDGGYYEEGGETYMSEDQVRKFLEEGGELEFV